MNGHNSRVSLAGLGRKNNIKQKKNEKVEFGKIKAGSRRCTSA